MKNNSQDTGNCYYQYPPYTPYTPCEPQICKVKRVIKTIDKYGPGGEYLGREVETVEEEIYDKQIWETGNIIISGDSILGVDYNNVSGDITKIDWEQPHTLTSSVNQMSFSTN